MGSKYIASYNINEIKLPQLIIDISDNNNCSLMHETTMAINREVLKLFLEKKSKLINAV